MICLSVERRTELISQQNKSIFNEISRLKNFRDTLLEISRIIRVNCIPGKNEIITKLEYIINKVKSLPEDAKCKLQ